jgi:hypothetical protein
MTRLAVRAVEKERKRVHHSFFSTIALIQLKKIILFSPPFEEINWNSTFAYEYFLKTLLFL